MLTLEELLQTAADRGYRLKVVEIGGCRYLTDGTRRPYPIPRAASRGMMPVDFLLAACRHFGLPPVDFSLDCDED